MELTSADQFTKVPGDSAHEAYSPTGRPLLIAKLAIFCQKMPDQVNQSSPAKGYFRTTLLSAVVIVLAAGGCEERVDLRGNLPDPKIIATIKPGFHKRSDVENLLGTPSAVATFNKEVWYYISGRVKTVSFFTPKVLGRNVLTVRFDRKGVVSAIQSRDIKKDKNIKIVERETPTKGKELTFIQQLIGNVGRFGQPGAKDSF